MMICLILYLRRWYSIAWVHYWLLVFFIYHHIDIWDDMSPEAYQLLKLEFGDIRMKCSPPFNDRAGNYIGMTIVPGQIKAIAVGVGMKPLLGFEEFQSNRWATSQ